MNGNKILCISGVRGSGKSLLANRLGVYGFQTASLAGWLKKKAQEEFNLTDEQLYGKEKEVPTGYKRYDSEGNVIGDLTARDILIRTGVFYRFIDPLWFCKRVTLFPLTVIDDIRFKNEVKYFKDLGAKFVRIERFQEDNVYKAALDDLSETELNEGVQWDFRLEACNNRTPADLAVFADYLWHHL